MAVSSRRGSMLLCRFAVLVACTLASSESFRGFRIGKAWGSAIKPVAVNAIGLHKTNIMVSL